MTEYKKIFDKNIERVQSMSSLYVKLKEENKSDGKDYRLTDILRSAVVFLHSSFEEYFRNVLIRWIPVKASSETLKKIPISINAGKKPDKLFLSDLAHYRDKSINDVIKESVYEYMNLKSFNNQSDIRAWLDKIGINIGDFQKLSEIDKAVHRRHKIVHEADINKKPDSENERLSPIKPGDIKPWIEAYTELVNLIDNQIEEWETENEQTNQ
jgi:hypothetical protein